MLNINLDSPRPRILSIFRNPINIQDLTEKVECPIEHEFVQFNVSRHTNVMRATIGHASSSRTSLAMSITIANSIRITIRSFMPESAQFQSKPQRKWAKHTNSLQSNLQLHQIIHASLNDHIAWI